MSTDRDLYLTDMGFPIWVLRQQQVVDPTADKNNKKLWSQLATAVDQCTLCSLHKSRTQTVFGVGRRDADLLIIGEAPGAEEDRKGEPFVGRAGKLLDKMLTAIQLNRKKVYISNVINYRPPENRKPTEDEIDRYFPYLKEYFVKENINLYCLSWFEVFWSGKIKVFKKSTS